MTRPSTTWRKGIEEESGSLEPEFAVLAELYPPDMLQRFDDIFDVFERDVSTLDEPSDGDVLKLIRKVVEALNSLNDDYDEDAIATDGREKLCEYIDHTLAAAGVDLDGLARRNSIPREDLTDEWRTW